jgi:hypothetical protein
MQYNITVKMNFVGAASVTGVHSDSLIEGQSGDAFGSSSGDLGYGWLLGLLAGALFRRRNARAR